MILEQLKKSNQKLQTYVTSFPTNAYRAFNGKVGNVPTVIDRYGDVAYVQSHSDLSDEVTGDVTAACADVFDIAADRVRFAVRTPGVGGKKYTPADVAPTIANVSEAGRTFKVEIGSRIDAGLFLDHREARKLVTQRLVAMEEARLLNLFAYTGSFSVWAATEGIQTTTVDISNRYLKWAKQNFELNKIDVSKHKFVTDDVLPHLKFARRKKTRYDVIVIDPPTFSKSKRADHDFDIQRDYPKVINAAVRLLTDDGVIFFSTNFTSFKLDRSKLLVREVEEISELTVPPDFSKTIHRAWWMKR